MIAKNTVDAISPIEQGADPGSTQRRRPGRPKGSKSRTKKQKKPYPSFPLTPHSTGQWCKKIRGKLQYFGTDADDALRQYREQAEGLHSGRVTVVAKGGRATVGDMVNLFLTEAKAKQERDEIGGRAFADYYRDCKRLVEFFGKSREVESISEADLRSFRDFLAKGVSVVTLNGRIGASRSLFLFAFDRDIIKTPLKLRDFKRPSRKQLRKARKAGGREYFFPEEIRKLLKVAPDNLRAMILLGVNCGLGNTDIASLPVTAIDLDEGWLDFARVKTGVDRRVPLWPETVQAIRKHLKTTKKGVTEETKGLLFITRRGQKFVRSVLSVGESGSPKLIESDAIILLFKRAMAAAGISLPGVAFYGLRKACETFGAETGDQVAVDHIMGHAPDADDMADVYRCYVAEESLRRVTDHVRRKVFKSSARRAAG